MPIFIWASCSTIMGNKSWESYMPFKEEPNVLSHLKKLESHTILSASTNYNFPLVCNMFFSSYQSCCFRFSIDFVVTLGTPGAWSNINFVHGNDYGWSPPIDIDEEKIISLPININEDKMFSTFSSFVFTLLNSVFASICIANLIPIVRQTHFYLNSFYTRSF